MSLENIIIQPFDYIRCHTRRACAHKPRLFAVTPRQQRPAQPAGLTRDLICVTSKQPACDSPGYAMR